MGSFLFDCLLKFETKSDFYNMFFNAHSENLLLFSAFFFYKYLWYYCRLWSYKKRMFFFHLFYVFFDVESESDVRFCRSPLFFKL